ncbi:MAG: formimidoylglutamate deiminase [Beijerinckiaceae bacterium]
MATHSFLFETVLTPEGWQHDVCVSISDGLIASIEPISAASRRDSVSIKGISVPGMPNLHSHTFQRGMAGLGERRGPAGDSFWTWRQVMYRFLEKLSPDDVEAIAAMAMLEMLEGGFTSLAEFHYLHHRPDGIAYANPAELAERIIKAAVETGIGLTLLPVFYAHGGFGGQEAQVGQRRFLSRDADAYLRLHERTAKIVSAQKGMVLGSAPHSLRAVTPDQLKALHETLPNGPIHIHIAEQTREVEDCLAWSSQRPVEWLLDHVPVDQHWCLIHATHMTGDETQRLARSGSVAGLCPITEANLGDGIFPGVDFIAHGGTYGVGSDSNVEISAPAELRLLEYGQRLSHRGRNLMATTEGQSTGEALYLAALKGGAQALQQPVGRIAVGCRADFVVLDQNHAALAAGGPELALDSFIFNGGKHAINIVISGGETVVENGRHIRREAIVQRFAASVKRLV